MPATPSSPDILYRLQTFGCKVNTYDSGLLETRFKKAGFMVSEAIGLVAANDLDADTRVGARQVHVLNTCAVTAEATAEALRTIRKIKRNDPQSVVVVTGCAAQVDTEKFPSSSGADLVVANSHKGDIENLIRQLLRGELKERVYKSNIFKKVDVEPGGGVEEGHTRSFLKIQDGCNSFCTFCVIPFARGKSRSIEIVDLRARVNELLEQGAREVVLTGVHIGDYEFGLENLIEDLLLRTRVPRLRLTSLEPIELSPRLFELFEDPRLCPHFHMSIQSAETSVLSRMKRKYGAAEVESALNEIAKRVPHAFVGMDVIVGFPGEGEDEFLETYTRLQNTPWTRIHVFPYSERPGTMALKLDRKNDGSTIARRADRLRELSHGRYHEQALRQTGTIKKVLILKNGQALSRDYWPINIDNIPSAMVNEEIAAKIDRVDASSKIRMDCQILATPVIPQL